MAELARERGAPVAICGDAPDAELPLPQGIPEALAAFPATVRAQQLALALATARDAVSGAPPSINANAASFTSASLSIILNSCASMLASKPPLAMARATW